MSEYQDTEKMLAELKALGSLNEKRQYLARLNARQLQLVNWRMPNEVNQMRELQKAVKKSYIERSTNYEKLIKEARKRFTDLDIEILEMLDDDMSWYARGIHRQINDSEHNNYSLEDVRKRLKLLQRRGLVEVISGLFNEDDGLLAGSGYSAVYDQSANISKIIASYHGENDTKELL
jgi:hypothetical protein